MKPDTTDLDLNESCAIDELNILNDQYEEEILDYESDENLMNYPNQEAIVSDPLSPVSTASYSYSVISQTSEPEENQATDTEVNEYDNGSETVEEVKSGLVAAPVGS